MIHDLTQEKYKILDRKKPLKLQERKFDKMKMGKRRKVHSDDSSPTVHFTSCTSIALVDYCHLSRKHSCFHLFV